MSIPVPGPISHEEEFGNAYRVFHQALEALAMEPAQTCEAYGHYNVAWEIVDDVSAGRYLFDNPSCPFSQQQRTVLAQIATALSNAPADVVRFTNIKQESLTQMSHAFWAPIRDQARAAVTLLGPITAQNARFM